MMQDVERLIAQCRDGLCVKDDTRRGVDRAKLQEVFGHAPEIMSAAHPDNVEIPFTPFKDRRHIHKAITGHNFDAKVFELLLERGLFVMQHENADLAARVQQAVDQVHCATEPRAERRIGKEILDHGDGALGTALCNLGVQNCARTRGGTAELFAMMQSKAFLVAPHQFR